MGIVNDVEDGVRTKLESDSKFPGSNWRDTVTSLYRRRKPEFLNHSSLAAGEKMIRILISLLLANLSAASVLPEVMSYAKVSRNGREDTGSGNDQTSWITRFDC